MGSSARSSNSALPGPGDHRWCEGRARVSYLADIRIQGCPPRYLDYGQGTCVPNAVNTGCRQRRPGILARAWRCCSPRGIPLARAREERPQEQDAAAIPEGFGLRARPDRRGNFKPQRLSKALSAHRMVAFRNRSITLRARRSDKRLQRFDVGWKLRCDLAHARHSIRFASPCGTRWAA